MKTGLKVFLTLLLRLRGLEEGSGRGTDGEGIQRGGGKGGADPHACSPTPRFCCRPARGSRDGSGAAGWVRLLSSVGGLAADAEPQKPQPPPCPFRCPTRLLPSFWGGSAARLLFDTWPFRFCLVTLEGAFQLPRNALSRRGEQRRRVL